MGDALLITCEHGGNRIPAEYRPLFARRRALLDSHRGHDPGALTMARQLARAFAAPLLAATVSRLLVDLNRSIGHPQVFSAATRGLPETARARIIAAHYLPYRDRVERYVRKETERGRRVVHISSHSFTPVLDGRVRRADAGLLYDPARAGEVAVCTRWKAALAACMPDLRVRRNYPYRGSGDGLTTHLRRCFAQGAYVGVELELNQAVVFAGGTAWDELRRAVVGSLRETLKFPGE